MTNMILDSAVKYMQNNTTANDVKLKRIAFTIVLNGLQHLQHNDYYKFILKNFDHWIIIEGASQNDGSTNWVKGSHYMTDADSEFHRNGSSIDGTVEFLEQLEKENKKIKVVYPDGGRPWNSKDEMVNKAIEQIKEMTDECFLWQIDVDEQWKIEDIKEAELQLQKSKIRTGGFFFNQFVGKNLITKGSGWGCNAMNRLWIWNGENFKTHEPAMLEGQTDYFLLPQIYNHYSYYFEKDVEFKAKWYYDDETILEKWKELQELEFYERSILPLSFLFPDKKYKNYTENTEIVHIDNPFEQKYDLIHSFFIHTLKSRREEFEKCMMMNLKNKYIRKIHVFFYDFKDRYLKDYPFLNDEKIELLSVAGGRNTFKTFMDYANTRLKGKIVIATNTDIWFDETLKYISRIDLTNKMVSLTRYECITNYEFHDDSGCCHDTVIFKSPIAKFDNDVAMGILGCDSMIHINAQKANIKLHCPSLDIKSYHEHSDIDHNSPTRSNRLPDGRCYWDHENWYDFLLFSTHINEETKVGRR